MTDTSPPMPTNPSEIAREVLRRLAGQRLPPTPDNFRAIYHEIAGLPGGGTVFPEIQLRSLVNSLPLNNPEQQKLARELELAVKNGNWDEFRNHLLGFIGVLSVAFRLNWSELLNDLLRQWDTKQIGLTPAKKRDSLEHILGSATSNPETLHTRLRNLVKSWAQNLSVDAAPAVEGSAEAAPGGNLSTAPAASVSTDLLPELRELFAFTLENAIAGQLNDSPQLMTEAQALAGQIRHARNAEGIADFLGKLKQFAFNLQLLSEDQAELRANLQGLLALLVKNIDELVLEDRWLHGQIEVVRSIIEKPLTPRALDEASRRLREVIFKQGQLKQSLLEAQQALKSLLASFVNQLATMADDTSDYHGKIEACAARITSADNLQQLEDVIGELMRETRAIQSRTRQSHEELRAAQDKVQAAEQRIVQLQQELDQASRMVHHDQLTGALNRRGLEEIFAKEISRAQRHQIPLCVALLDIDNFKKLNDAYGHSTGDAALIHLTNVIRDTLRPQDSVARYGGEEFIILLPETDLNAGQAALTRLQRELTKTFFLHNNEKLLITFSAGVTQMRDEDNQQQAIERADQAMYEAKKSGKNRVVST
ncbi:MAG: hypothetical protein RIR00_992 [Pseudomonadota bacterium]|jgi:diguanylate cyclase